MSDTFHLITRKITKISYIIKISFLQLQENLPNPRLIEPQPNSKNPIKYNPQPRYSET